MRIRKRGTQEVQGDLTPMIDMVFQLIAFFMVLINFSDAEQDDRVKLPESEVAKPPESPLEDYVTIQLTKDAECLYAGRPYSLSEIEPVLAREVRRKENEGKSVSDMTVIIRAHKEVATGKVQELIRICQEARYINFVLRAKEKQNY